MHALLSSQINPIIDGPGFFLEATLNLSEFMSNGRIMDEYEVYIVICKVVMYRLLVLPAHWESNDLHIEYILIAVAFFFLLE